MPYIERRLRLSGLNPESPGELNYVLTKVCINYLLTKGKKYETLNDIIGALECCKFEFSRRVISDYENKKMVENSDCYPEEALWL